MKFRLTFAAVMLFALAAPAAASAQVRSEAPLTNTSVVKLVRAGFSEKAVIAIIRARPVRFDLAPERLIELKKGGVSEKVILAMLAREQAEVAVAEEWGDDDAFFNDGVSKNLPRSSEPGGTDIFGSSGGASGRSRSNGGRGGVESDTQSVGSATVRILRPPASEAGGTAAAPKMERTPTLTNDSVVELVEAGFSEGTIVRRIELSPVEFDLTPEKLAELRKRRVTETVIAAMRSAMGETVEQPAKPEK